MARPPDQHQRPGLGDPRQHASDPDTDVRIRFADKQLLRRNIRWLPSHPQPRGPHPGMPRNPSIERVNLFPRDLSPCPPSAVSSSVNWSSRDLSATGEWPGAGVCGLSCQAGFGLISCFRSSSISPERDGRPAAENPCCSPSRSRPGGAYRCGAGNRCRLKSPPRVWKTANRPGVPATRRKPFRPSLTGPGSARPWAGVCPVFLRRGRAAAAPAGRYPPGRPPCRPRTGRRPAPAGRSSRSRTSPARSPSRSGRGRERWSRRGRGRHARRFRGRPGRRSGRLRSGCRRALRPAANCAGGCGHCPPGSGGVPADRRCRRGGAGMDQAGVDAQFLAGGRARQERQEQRQVIEGGDEALDAHQRHVDRRQGGAHAPVALVGDEAAACRSRPPQS